MLKLAIKFDWDSIDGPRGPELSATWAHFEIRVGDMLVTRLEDRNSKRTRDEISSPLYPLAEWMATNWWSLLYEIDSPYRSGIDGYNKRHNVSAASEGFALPSLRIQPEGKQVHAVWKQLALPEYQVSFLNWGEAWLDREQVEEEFRTFISSVITRLEEKGVRETLLSEEWKAIVNADPDEKAFCIAAGQLGRDPYSLNEDDVEALIAVIQSLPASVREEFLGAANYELLREQGNAIRQFVEKADKTTIDLKPLRELRGKISPDEVNLTPWQQGYRAAQQLWARLGQKDKRVRSVSELGVVFKLNNKEWSKATVKPAEELRFLDAVVASTRTGSPYFAVESKAEHYKTFAVCRGLFEYLIAEPRGAAALVTKAYSERQKRNRAFAAEFIAPADELRNLVKTPLVTVKEIQELASEFGTSEYAIYHQLRNHRIARTEYDLGWGGAVA